MDSISAKKMNENAKETFGIADIINVLGNDFSNIYLVDREKQSVEIYRYENELM